MNKKNLTETYYHLVLTGDFGISVEVYKTKKELRGRLKKIEADNVAEKKKEEEVEGYTADYVCVYVIIKGKQVKTS